MRVMSENPHVYCTTTLLRDTSRTHTMYPHTTLLVFTCLHLETLRNNSVLRKKITFLSRFEGHHVVHVKPISP